MRKNRLRSEQFVYEKLVSSLKTQHFFCMKIIYTYPTRKIIFPNIIVLAFPLVIILLYLIISLISSTPKTLPVEPVMIFIISIVILIPAITILLMINKIKTKIEITERGIHYDSLFSDLFIEWIDISSIERKYLFERRYPREDLPPGMMPLEADIKDLLNVPYSQQSDLPNDLIIKTNKNKKIKILHALKQNDDSGKGIKEFENNIKEYGGIDIEKIERDKVYEKDKKEWRLLLIVAIMIIAAGIFLSLIEISLISLAFIFLGIWLFLIYFVDYVSRYIRNRK